MAARIQSYQSDVLQAIETKLVADTVIGNSAGVLWWIDDSEPAHIAGQQDIVLRPLSSTPNIENAMGGCRQAMYLECFVDVTLRSSMAVDRVNTAKQRYIRHCVYQHRLLDSLIDFFPQDGSDNAMTIAALQLVQAPRPTKVGNDKAWLAATLTFSYQISPKIDRTIV